MPPLVYSRHEMLSVVPPESPIEGRMAELLEDIPGFGWRAMFMRVDTVADACRILAEHADLGQRYPVLIFPQPAVDCYRPDFLVVVTAPDAAVADWPSRAFLVECDGEEFHGAHERVRADRAREREIRRWTGLEVVRFSGAEINFAPGAVLGLLGAIVNLRLAIQAHPQLAETDRILELRARLSEMTSLPTLRRQHVGRNSLWAADPYDAVDPVGDFFDGESHLADAALDGLGALRVDRAWLAHDVVRARSDWRRSDAAWQEEEPDGGLVPFDQALAGAIEGAAERFFARF